MNNFTKAKRLKLYMSNTDKFKHEPLYEVIIYAAKRYGLEGATATIGVMGFGSSSQVSRIRLWEISEKIPVVVEIIDVPDKIELFMQRINPYFDKIQSGCLITSEEVEIVLQKIGTKRKNWF